MPLFRVRAVSERLAGLQGESRFVLWVRRACYWLLTIFRKLRVHFFSFLIKLGCNYMSFLIVQQRYVYSTILRDKTKPAYIGGAMKPQVCRHKHEISCCSTQWFHVTVIFQQMTFTGPELRTTPRHKEETDANRIGATSPNALSAAPSGNSFHVPGPAPTLAKAAE